MGKFNFGERRTPGYKKKVGAWDHPRRSDTPIERSDVATIARLYFVGQVGLGAIADQFDVGPADIKKIVQGYNFHQDWSVAVTDLIAEGHACVRDHKVKKEDRRDLLGTLRPERLEADVVLDIRRRHMDGQSLTDILKATGLRVYRVRAILKNETFNSDEYKPPGWRMDTSDWRKDSD